jgi:hypothetical protein
MQKICLLAVLVATSNLCLALPMTQKLAELEQNGDEERRIMTALCDFGRNLLLAEVVDEQHFVLNGGLTLL